MFDIDGLKPMTLVNEGAKLMLKNPNNMPAVRADGEPLWIKVRSFYSTATRDAQHKIQDQRIADAKNGLGNNVSAASMEQDSVDNLVSVTVEWNLQDKDGTAIPCTAENARKLFTDPLFSSVRQQVNTFANENANFIAA